MPLQRTQSTAVGLFGVWVCQPISGYLRLLCGSVFDCTDIHIFIPILNLFLNNRIVKPYR